MFSALSSFLSSPFVDDRKESCWHRKNLVSFMCSCLNGYCRPFFYWYDVILNKFLVLCFSQIIVMVKSIILLASNVGCQLKSSHLRLIVTGPTWLIYLFSGHVQPVWLLDRFFTAVHGLIFLMLSHNLELLCGTTLSHVSTAWQLLLPGSTNFTGVCRVSERC